MTSMFACSSMHISDSQMALMVFFFAGWWVSGALAFINPSLIFFLKATPRFKTVNFVWWALYFLPGAVLLLLGLYEKIPFGRTLSNLSIFYALAIPFIAVSHFVFLLWTRRKLRARKNKRSQENNTS